MKRIITILICILQFACTFAQKALYIPAEWKVQRTDTLLYSETDTEGKYTWSKSRSKESDNFICYWDKYYTTEPSKLATSNYYYVNVDELLQKAESFYALNVGKLAFCEEASSKVSKYKMLILLNHTDVWTCYGAGYDFTIGALWLNPATCKPIGQSVAHEVGHSFQYMCYSDLGGHAGFHDAIGSGSTFWEQTAQWQSVQAYPELKWSQSWTIFHKVTNYAMTHEWMRYQSYWWHYFLADKYGIDIIGKLWRHQISKASDPNEVFMDMMGYDVNQLYKDYFDYAMKMATFDMDACRSEADLYIDKYIYNNIPLGGTKYQVAYSSCPQTTGFNIIPLNVPDAGTEVSVDFTSLKINSPLADGDPAEYLDGDSKYASAGVTKYNYASTYRHRGFRIGYVALLADGTRDYGYTDSVYCQSTSGTFNNTCTVSYKVPENTKQMWLVVVPAPKIYYQHKWDDNIKNDEQWPYTVEFKNTDIESYPVISDDLTVSDATITYDVYFPKSTNLYDGTSVKVEGKAASVLGTALQMQISEINSKMASWASAGPADGQIMFYAVNANGNVSNAGSSANGYGHWFSATGNRTAYSGGYLFSEFDPSAVTFNIGQYPGKLTNGKDYSIAQALVYKKGARKVTVTFVFNVHINDSKTGYKITSVKQSEMVTGIQTPTSAGNVKSSLVNVADLTGRVLKRNVSREDAFNGLGKGVYIVNGKKMIHK